MDNLTLQVIFTHLFCHLEEERCTLEFRIHENRLWRNGEQYWQRYFPLTIYSRLICLTISKFSLINWPCPFHDSANAILSLSIPGRGSFMSIRLANTSVKSLLASNSLNACNMIPKCKCSTISSDKVPGKLPKLSLCGGIVFPKTLITHV